MGASRPKRPMHTSESAAIVVAHSLRVQDVDMLCAPRVLQFYMQWKRNAMPCREEGSHRSAKGRSEKMRLCIASRLLPKKGVPSHLTRGAPSWSSARGLEKKIACVNFRTSGVSFSRYACCFVSFIRPANGEGEPPGNAALRAHTRTRASTAFRFLPSLLHPVAGSR